MPFVQPLKATIRPAVQAAVAAAVAYAVMRLAGWHGNTSWAVISALYVVQPSLDGTLSNALARLVGTGLGTAFGLASLYTVGHWPPGVAVSLALGVLLLTTVSGYHPGLRFGLIPAAVLMLASSGDPLSAAWPRAGAIGLGALVGTAASLLVFPKAANRSVEQGLGRAVRRCGALLHATVDAMLGVRPPAVDPINTDIRHALETTSAQVGQSLRQRERHGSRRRRPGPGELHHAVRRLWHSILMLERAGSAPVPVEWRARLDAPLRRFREVAGGYLDLIGGSLCRDAPAPNAGELERCAAELEAAVAGLPRSGAGLRESERLFVLAFAVGQVGRDIGAIAALMEEET